jgi:hypothetical protein
VSFSSQRCKRAEQRLWRDNELGRTLGRIPHHPRGDPYHRGDFSFLDQFTVDVDASFAQVEEGNTLSTENVQITDKSSGTTKFVKGLFRWQEV